MKPLAHVLAVVIVAAGANGQPGAPGDLYVANLANNTITQHAASTGMPVGIFVSTDLAAPFELVFAPGNRLLVTNASSNQVSAFDATTGASQGVFASLDTPTGLTLGPGGNVFVSSAGSGSVIQYDGATGALISVFATGIGAARGLAFGPSGDLYVVSQSGGSVLEFDGATGAPLGVFASGLSNPEGLVFGPSGDLFVSSGSEVKQFNGVTGALLGTFASGLGAADGLTFSSAGNLFVADGVAGAVKEFDGATGAFIRDFATGLAFPYGLAFKPIPSPGALACAIPLALLAARRCRARTQEPLMPRTSPIIVASLVLVPAAAAQTTFTPLGSLSPANFYSVGLGISDDGQYVVGASHHDPVNDEAFRWDRKNGMLPLGFYPGGYPLSVANAVSLNGLVAGLAAGASGIDWQPARFAYPSPPVNLGAIPGGSFNGNANGISADGSIIVGYTRLGNPTEAFRWTQATGMVGLGNVLGAGGSSWGNAISSDGSTIVGWTSAMVTGGFGQCAFRWTQAGGMVSLGDMRTVGALSVAFGVSSDGAYVVGSGTIDGPPPAGYLQVPFRWHGFMQNLGWLPGGSSGRAVGVTADGNTVVGESTSNSPHTWAGQEVFLWTEADGMRSLRELLITDHNLGTALEGWVLAAVGGITPDGRFIVGTGFNPAGQSEAWLVEFGADCYPDCNEDGALTVADFGCFQTAFVLADPYADCNGDGTLTVADFGCFQTQFVLGCP